MGAEFDINRYGLGIDLQLNNSSVLQGLDAIGDLVDDLEKDISKAAASAMSSLGDVANQGASQMGDFAESLKDAMQSATGMVEPTLDIQDAIDAINHGGKELAIYHKQESEFYDEKLGMMTGIGKMQEQQNAFAFITLDTMRLIAEAIRLKNLRHADQNNHMEHTNDLADEANAEFNEQRQHVGHLGRGWKSILRDVIMLRGAYGMINSDVERFYTANFRALGSQIEIVRQTTELSKEHGILRDVALDAYEALGNLKAPREQIDEYAKSVTLTNRITGVGVRELSEYVVQMKAVGFGASQSSQHLAWMGQAMRKLRLSTEDVNRTMHSTSVSALTLAASFSEGADAPAKFNRLKMVIAGLGKEFNMSSDGLEKMMERIATDPVFGAIAADVAQLGRPIDSIDDLHDAMRGLSDRFAELYRRRQMGGDIGRDATIEMKTFAEQLGIADFESLTLIGRLKGFEQQLGKTADGAHLLTLQLSDQDVAAQKMAAEYKDATETVVRSMAEIGAKVKAMWVTVQYWVERFLGPVLKVVSKGLDWASVALDKFSAWIDWLDGRVGSFLIWEKPISAMAGAIFTVGGMALLVIPAIRHLGRAFGLLGGMGGMVGGVLGGIGAAFATVNRVIIGTMRTITVSVGMLARAVAGTITTIAGGIGVGLELMLAGLGRGLAFLGSSVTGVLPQLFGLGAAAVLAGAGAYLLAGAVQLVAQQGEAGMAALFGLTAAMTAAGLAFTGIAYLAAPVTPVLLALGGAMLLIGGAAMGLGYGLKLAADAFATLSAVAMDGSMVVKLGLLSIGLGALGLAASLGAGPLLAVGAAMFLISSSVWLLTSALGGVSPAFRSLGNAASKVGSLFDGMGSAIAGAIGAVLGYGKKLFGWLRGLAGDIVPYGWEIVKSLWRGVVGGVNWAGSQLMGVGRSLMGNLWDGIKSGWLIPFGGFGALFGSLTNLIKQYGPSVASSMSAAFKGAAVYAWDALSSATMALPGMVTKILNQISSAVFGWVSSEFSKWKNAGVKLAGAMLSGIVALPAASAGILMSGGRLLYGAGAYLGSSVASGIKSAIGGTISAAGSMLNGVGNVLSSGWSMAKDAGSLIGSGVVYGIKGAGGAIFGVAGSVISGTVAVVSSFGSAARDAGAGLLKSVTDGFSSGAKAAYDLASGVVAGMRDTLYAGVKLVSGALSSNKVDVSWVDGFTVKMKTLKALSSSLDDSFRGVSTSIDKLSSIGATFIGLSAKFDSFSTSWNNAVQRLRGVSLADVVLQQTERLEDATAAALKTLTDYATALDGVASKIEETISAKAPAMLPMMRDGGNAVPSEPIATVQVKNASDEPREQSKSPEVNALESVNATLLALLDVVAKVVDKSELVGIKAILEAHLPELAMPSSGGDLSSHLNEWGR